MCVTSLQPLGALLQLAPVPGLVMLVLPLVSNAPDALARHLDGLPVGEDFVAVLIYVGVESQGAGLDVAVMMDMRAVLEAGLALLAHGWRVWWCRGCGLKVCGCAGCLWV